MGRNVPLARRKRADRLPLCIFPKGKKAGIRCVTVQTLSRGGETVTVCDEALCCYNEETDTLLSGSVEVVSR